VSGTIVQTAAQYLNNGSAGTSWSVSLDQAVGVGNAVVVFLGNLGESDDGISVTDDQGNVYTVTNFGTTAAGGTYQIGLAYALDITNAPTAIVLEAPSISYPQMVIAEVAGIYGLDANGFQNNTSTTTPSSPGVTTTLPGDFVIGFIATESGSTTSTAGTGFTQIGPPSGGTNFIMEYQTAAAAGGVAAGFNLSPADSSGAGIAAFTTGTTVISDSAVPAEFAGSLAVETDSAVPVEFAAGLMTDAEIQLESLASQALPPLWIEWLAAVRADAAAPLESIGAVLVTDDNFVPIAVLGALRGDHPVPTESIGSLHGESGASAESLSAARADGSLPAELLGATLLIADALLPLEVRQALAAVLLSLETGPGRIRLLATPGRVRLVRRS